MERIVALLLHQVSLQQSHCLQILCLMPTEKLLNMEEARLEMEVVRQAYVSVSVSLLIMPVLVLLELS